MADIEKNFSLNACKMAYIYIFILSMSFLVSLFLSFSFFHFCKMNSILNWVYFFHVYGPQEENGKYILVLGDFTVDIS